MDIWGQIWPHIVREINFDMPYWKSFFLDHNIKNYFQAHALLVL